jgi:ATP-dependent helicase HrpA
MGGSRIRPEDWDLERVPSHLRLTFVVHEGAAPGSPVVDRGPDLAALAARHAPRTADALGEATAQVGPDLRRQGLRTWAAGEPPDLPEVIEVERAGGLVQGYPALVDDGDSVSVQVLGSAEEAQRAHARGVRRVLALDLPDPGPAALRTLSNQQRLALAAPPHRGGTAALLDDVLDATLDVVMAQHGPAPRTAEAYATLRKRVGPLLPQAFAGLLADIAALLAAGQEIRRTVSSLSSMALLPALSDVGAQLDALLADGFVTAAGGQRIPDLQRYLEGIAVRLSRISDHRQRDDAAMWQVHQLQDELADAVARLPGSRRDSVDVDDIRWMLEELRVSLFAQPLRTAFPVSDKRIRRAIAGL